MKRLTILAASFALVVAATAAQAMTPAPLGLSSDVQKAGVICGPGMHLAGVVCVPNHPVVMRRACPLGWHLGVGGVCRRN